MNRLMMPLIIRYKWYGYVTLALACRLEVWDNSPLLDIETVLAQ